MTHFTISQHNQLPLCEAKVVARIKPSKEWVLRYQMDDVASSETPVRLLDERMGTKCKAPGVYAAKFDEVYAVWRDVLASAPEEPAAPTAEPERHAGTSIMVVAAGCFVVIVATIARIAIIPFYLMALALTGGAPTVVASIAMIDSLLQVRRLRDNLGRMIHGAHDGNNK